MGTGKGFTLMDVYNVYKKNEAAVKNKTKSTSVDNSFNNSFDFATGDVKY
jgi:hypothetical protein